MTPDTHDIIRDFSIIFKKIDEYNASNSISNMDSKSDVEMLSETKIREFYEICKELNSQNETQVTHVTFS